MKPVANMPLHGGYGGGYGHGYGCGFLIIVVLFILLIIIGATAFHGKDDCDKDESSSSH
ncbi:YjcZ family sporulation protein [Fictibacillus halophilus]|uniref:YjcZ family sporulation protein n=1 Tax=Fictibacillus halophilus TaxID=1610490 RepID=UPI00362D83B7